MLDSTLLQELDAYILRYEKLLVVASVSELHTETDYIIGEPSPSLSESRYDYRSNVELDSYLQKNRGQTFRDTLFKLIDSKRTTATSVYHKAGIDRKHFSKIRSGQDYRPGKRAVIALGFALELNQIEFYQLLSSAGYSLSRSDTFDLIVQFFLEKKHYDPVSIDQAMEYFSLQPLFSTLE